MQANDLKNITRLRSWHGKKKASTCSYFPTENQSFCVCVKTSVYFIGTNLTTLNISWLPKPYFVGVFCGGSTKWPQCDIYDKKYWDKFLETNM